MENSLSLQVLDPEKDIDLFKRAYGWRTPKRHVGADRMPFESFIDTDPKQLVLGLFNGDLQAVYLSYEYEPRRFDVHYTSSREAPLRNVLAGAQNVMKYLMDNGAQEVSALIVKRNKPLCRFVEALGMKRESLLRYSSVDGERNQRTFVKYAKRA